MSQQIKCIRIQVDCRIHSKIPEPNAARFGQPLIVECLFNCQARLHQHQSKIKLSHINRSANVSTKSQDPFLRRQFPERVKLRFPIGCACQVTIWSSTSRQVYCWVSFWGSTECSDYFPNIQFDMFPVYCQKKSTRQILREGTQQFHATQPLSELTQSI